MIKKAAIFVFMTCLLASCSNSKSANDVDEKEESSTEFFSPLKLF